MLSTKNCKRAFEFVKFIIRIIVIFFNLGYNKYGIFNDIIIMNTFIRPKTETDRQADRYIQMKT